MSTKTRLEILRGPALHEMVDSLKYSVAPSGRKHPVDFAVEDVDGSLTGFLQPVLEANITGIRHCDHRTVFIWGIFVVKNSRDGRQWQTGPSEYTHAPAGSRGGLLLLEQIK